MRRAWTRGLRERVMGASRQCQQHIPLNQKQRPCTIPHTRRREVQGRVRHFGGRVRERVGIGTMDQLLHECGGDRGVGEGAR